MSNAVAAVPLSELTFVAFDTETTGISPVSCQLLELSGVKFTADGTILDKFSSLIDPKQPIPAQATAVHGITNDMVQGQPTYREIVARFFEWVGVGNVVLVAHNAAFDVGFLDVALAKMRAPIPSIPVLDTLSLSRQLLPNLANHQLRTLVEHLRLHAKNYHRALADSEHVMGLLLRLLNMVPGVSTWESLLNFCACYSFSNLAHTDNPPCAGYSGADLTWAIESGSKVTIVYRGLNSTTTRMVTPHTMLTLRGNSYLSGYCHMARAERTFRVDKIVSVRPVPLQL